MDSADVAAGEVFLAVPGSQAHGASFAAQAQARGALAIITDQAGAQLVAAGEQVNLPVVVVADVRACAAPISAAIYGHPAKKLLTTAVTGTNGKTTTSYYVQAILEANAGPAGLLGTIELRLPGVDVPSPRTTLESPVLHRLLAVAVERGVQAMSLEASSHGLQLDRFAALQATSAGFTNLQHDHLDFHHTMDEYLAAKALLFTPEKAKSGVICIDDEWGRELSRISKIPALTLQTYGSQDLGAQWRVGGVEHGRGEFASRFELRGPDGEHAWIDNPLPGQVNISNAALAVLMAVQAGVEFSSASAAVSQLRAVPGRMQQVLARSTGGPLGYVDHAHTPESLALALQMLRPLTPGRLVVVIGAGGDRDPLKRPKLGQVSAQLADVVIVTDDNPRTEEPAPIRQAVLEGAHRAVSNRVRVLEVADRREAIAAAVDLAQSQDTILVAGKGHEDYQEIHGVKYPMDDVEILARLGANRWGVNA